MSVLAHDPPAGAAVLPGTTHGTAPGNVPRAPVRHRRLAFLLKSLGGGGVQRMTFAMARCCLARGHAVDLLVCEPEGVLADAVPEGARLVHLEPGRAAVGRLLALAADPLGLDRLLLPVLAPRHAHWTLAHLGALARHLARERPEVLITGTPRLNLLAVWARRLARAPVRLLISERTAPSQDYGRGDKWPKLYLPRLMRRAYAQSDVVVAVSGGVADDLAALTSLPRGSIRTIYNPVVGPELARLAAEPPGHPWLRPGRPPVVLGAGRLSAQKDFPTLIRAFARLRARRTARLVILGSSPEPEQTAERVGELRALATSLGVAADVDLPGYVANPYAPMARAGVFALSSAFEGFGNVLVEALACGCPVVSTDCPSGPAEILEGGRHGPLVPVGDDAAMALALERMLDAPPAPESLRRRAGEFTVERATDAYLEALFGDD